MRVRPAAIFTATAALSLREHGVDPVDQGGACATVHGPILVGRVGYGPFGPRFERFVAPGLLGMDSAVENRTVEEATRTG